jgi:hypothetical protein
MLSKLSRFLTIATLTTLTCVVIHPAHADDHLDYNEFKTTYNVEELINEAFWRNESDFFEDSKPGGFLNSMLGWGSFPLGSYPETEMTKDALILYTIMNDYYKQQQENDPVLKTRDLDNPFSTSLREQPNPPVPDNPIIRRESTFQEVQRVEPMADPEPITPNRPVRGLY